VRRLTILLATVGVLLLIPATQAFAGTLKVNIEGSGSGEVSSVEGLGFVDPEFAGLYEGSPPMECSYNAETEATSGVCENTLTNEEGFETETVHAVADFGSEFAGWIVEKGGLFNSYCEASEGETGYEACAPAGLEGEPNEFEVTAVFSECQEGSKAPTCPEEPSGPTNLRTLTVTKSPSPAAGTGAGSVSSKPKGIKCGPACSEAVASMYKATPVLLKAKPTTTSTFVEWTGACAGVEGLECTIPMAEDEEVGAVFTGTSKALEPAEALTVNKGESSGQGTVKGTGGLGCEAQCTSTTVLYQGPTGEEPKIKPGKTVTLKQAPAFGSAFIGWVGCDSEVEGNCVVEMDEDHTVSAEYEALPNKVLTVNKAYSSGNGAVSSKPKGVKCGPACTQAVANMPEGAEIALKEKPGSETTFVEWENAIEGGDCDGSTAEICVVGMDKDETIKAVFSKTSKVLKEESEATLTVSKGEGTGFGTVKGTGGLGCEFLCTSTSVVYQGPISLPKPKPGKTVKLKAISAPGSAAVEWSGCTGFEEEGAICLVEMSESKEVVATFNELE